MKIFLEFLLEIVKVIATLIRALQKDDPLTIKSNGANREVIIPKSIIITFFFCLMITFIIIVT